MVKFIKLLKSEVRVDGTKFNTNDVERFLEALRNDSVLLKFLNENEEFYTLLFERFNFLKDYGIPNFDSYDFYALKQQLSDTLLSELQQFVVTRLEQSDYMALKVLLKYRALLPDEVLDLLTHRLEFKLDGYLASLTKKGILNDQNEFKKVSELIQLHPSTNLLKKEKKVKELLAQELYDALGSINKPGIVFFFEVMTQGFYYLFHVPTDARELKIRRRVLADFKFMSGILGVVILILAVGILFLKKDEPIKQTDLETKGFYESFVKPAQNNVFLIGNYSDTLKTGFDFVTSSYQVKKSDETVTINNSTDYDLIVFTDFDIVKDFSKIYGNTKYKGNFIYIKSKESLTMDSAFYPMHFYFGQTLFSTNAPYQEPANLPRFFHMHKNTTNLIKKTFELKAAKITFEGDKNAITLRANKKIFMNSVPVSRITF
ncbi:hypothetical protein [Flavobacterium sp.]|uniref:hypothetical protein n=1 Tax=Flavobacterium sp. TaxID=239 RepID=UPI002618EA09|nr:hypothetical protein [Flavobacterium sp.]